MSIDDKKIRSTPFEVTIKGMHAIDLPESIVTPFIDAGQQRVRVIATFEGKSIEFHAALQKYQGRYRLTFGKSKQKQLGLFPSDYFQLQLFEDHSKYGVDVPEELAAVLETDTEAYKIFESFTPGKKRSIIYMIARFKNSQTRIDKALLLCENIKRGIRDHREILKQF
ncbi:YdeI/OmpD-associated family protein [Sungkyunkwania multivorans]|uniref:YdeI/OmpD-associated family protein n=1 Tax=Sungkyunkwania multivorans TaxID=1173618 RepID=A0ABW3CUH8_9FLAO